MKMVYQIISQRTDPNDYEWYSHWIIILKEENLTIGGIGANGLPDSNGEVIIGYYIDKKYEGRGFATEALQAFVGWMILNQDVKCVIADTLVNNLASQRVLQKNVFVLRGPVEEGLRWEKKIVV